MTQTETLRLALEYVELVPDDRYNAEHIDQDALITAIKSALQAKDEPVAWMSEEDDCIFLDKDKPNPMDYDFWTPLYTTPPQRTWIGLTDEEIAEALGDEIDSVYMTDFRRVEAKLKEKNT